MNDNMEFRLSNKETRKYHPIVAEFIEDAKKAATKKIEELSLDKKKYTLDIVRNINNGSQPKTEHSYRLAGSDWIRIF